MNLFVWVGIERLAIQLLHSIQLSLPNGKVDWNEESWRPWPPQENSPTINQSKKLIELICCCSIGGWASPEWKWKSWFLFEWRSEWARQRSHQTSSGTNQFTNQLIDLMKLIWFACLIWRQLPPRPPKQHNHQSTQQSKDICFLLMIDWFVVWPAHTSIPSTLLICSASRHSQNKELISFQHLKNNKIIITVIRCWFILGW